MARPKAFDPELAVEQAMHAFWCRGYEATSVADLVDELGIGRASLYATFGSKDELYGRALDRYRELETRRVLACLGAEGPVRPRLRALLERMVTDGMADPDNRGCLVLNAALERAGTDPATARRVGEAMAQFEEALHGLLVEARARGELGPDRDPRELARFLTTALQGLRVMAKATRDEAVLRDAVAVTLRALD